MPLKLRILFCAAAALVLAGCASDKPFAAGPHLTLVDASSLPPPVDAVDGDGLRQYRIGAFDRLNVQVFRAPELTRSVSVDGAGFVSLPLVGLVEAGGLTPHQFEELLEDRLRGAYLRQPEVSVVVENAVSQTVTVEGEVEEPGVYPVPGSMTLVQLVATAKGTTEFAKLEDVVIFRKVGNQNLAGLYNLDAIRRGSYPDPEVYPGDVVVVGDSQARRRFRDILEGSTLITTPIIALINLI